MIGRFLKRLGLVLLALVGGRVFLSQYLEKNPAEGKTRPRVVLGGCLLFLGLFTIVSTIAWNFGEFRTGFWPTASGVVQTSEARRSRSYRIEASVRVEYTVDGVTYSTSRIQLEPTSYRDIRFAIEDADRYPVGETVAVAYNPREPHFGILEPGYDLMSNRFFVFGLCLCVVGVGFFCMQLARSVSLEASRDPFKSPDRLP
jgi:hypothetical protein